MMHELPIAPRKIGGAASHLAVRYQPAAVAGAVPEARPAEGAAAPCLVYMHGFGSRQDGEKADFFRRRARAAGIAFCSFDFQGHGASGGGMRELTLTRNLEDLETVVSWLEAAGERRFCLVGSSMGGGTALWYSALHPGRVAAGMHIAPAIELERLLLAWAGPERARRWEETGVLAYHDEMVSCELGWQLIEDLRAHAMADLLARYRTPALLLQGRLDTAVPWRGVADFVARCPFREIELHLFGDGDHRMTDRLDRLWSLMLEYLRGKGLIGR
jgi:pimeloyl-ACP methyl ester carboxylesterase